MTLSHATHSLIAGTSVKIFCASAFASRALSYTYLEFDRDEHSETFLPTHHQTLYLVRLMSQRWWGPYPTILLTTFHSRFPSLSPKTVSEYTTESQQALCNHSSLMGGKLLPKGAQTGVISVHNLKHARITFSFPSPLSLSPILLVLNPPRYRGSAPV